MYLDFYKSTRPPEKVVIGETRVILLGGFYTSTTTNPAWSGDYACVGTVIQFNTNSMLQFKVLWDNGLTNSYGPYELRISGGPSTKLKENNPNRTFKKKKGEEGHETSRGKSTEC